jgi:hypothetical protein
MCAVGLLWSIGCGAERREPARASGSGWLSIVHHHKMGESFLLERLAYEVDGQRIFDEEGVAVQQPLEVLLKVLPAGEHDVRVLVRYRGNGHGVFQYLNKYKFRVRSKHTVTVVNQAHVRLSVMAIEKGGATTPLEQRPAVEFRADQIALPAFSR